MNGLSDDQIRVLLAPVKPHRVKTLDGNSYVEQHDIRAMLIRVFGFCGWSLSESVELAFEERDGIDGADVKVKRWNYDLKQHEWVPGVRVCYRAHARITIHVASIDDPAAEYDGTGSHTAVMGGRSRGDAHDSAMKSAASAALKRAAINLGDQFGLGLYEDGSLEPLVRKIVGWSDPKIGSSDPVEEAVDVFRSALAGETS